MITFKQFLDEKAMSSKEFEKTASRQGKSAKVGYEFELLVPHDTKLHGAGEDRREVLSLRSLDSLADLEKYFEISISEGRSIENEYENWKQKKLNDWVDDNLDQDLIDSEGEKYAKKAAEDQYNDSDDTFEEFVNDEYGSYYQLLASYTCYPRFGWRNDDRSDKSEFYDSEGNSDLKSELTFDAIRSSLEDWINNGWNVVSDSSIDGDGVGAEVISPPTNLEDALKDLKIMFKWMNDHNLETNKTTGLHINISLANMANIDTVKLILFLGEKHVLKAFQRENNSYTAPQIDRIISGISKNGWLPKDAASMQNDAKTLMSQAKYSSVNLGKLRHGYLEFRIAGGENYHHDYEKIRNTTLRFVTALEIACDPNAERELYIKKLSQVFGKAADSKTTNEYDNYSIPDLLALDGNENTISNYRTWQKNIKDGRMTSPSTKERFSTWVLEYLIPNLLLTMEALHMSNLSSKQRAELKLMITKADVDANKIISQIEASNRGKFSFLQKTK